MLTTGGRRERNNKDKARGTFFYFVSRLKVDTDADLGFLFICSLFINNMLNLFGVGCVGFFGQFLINVCLRRCVSVCVLIFLSAQKAVSHPVSCSSAGSSMPSPLFHPEIMDHDAVVSAQQTGVALSGEPEPESRDEEHQDALRFALDQFSLMTMDKVDSLDGTTTTGSGSENCNGSGAGGGGGGGYVDLPLLDHPGGSRGSPSSCSPSPEYYGSGGYHMAPHTHAVLGDQSAALCNRKRSVNMTECVPVPSSEHVAEIVGRQGGFTSPVQPL